MPPILDLRNADARTLIPTNVLDEAEVEAVRVAWLKVIQPYFAEDSIRVQLPKNEVRTAIALAANQALKAQNPSIKLFLCYDEDAPPNWDEVFWGAFDGGVIASDSLKESPSLWLSVLDRAQSQLPARPWTIWCPIDPGATAGVLIGRGAILVVPFASPTAKLAESIPTEMTEVEGLLGKISVSSASGKESLHWVFMDNRWLITTPAQDQETVTIEGKADYDVQSILSKVRATQLRDSTALFNQECQLNISIHTQSTRSAGGRGRGGIGGEFGYIFHSFQTAGEPEELLQEQVLLNGVKANIIGKFQLPIIESKRSISPPILLNLTEKYRYADGGSGGDGKRWIRFSPISSNSDMFTGQILVDELSGRIFEERSERANLPGIVKSERRKLVYGEPAPGFWRVIEVESFEQWVMAGGVTQVQRYLSYSGFIINQDDFLQRREAARASNSAMLRQTEDGMRYLVRDETGNRQIQHKQPSFARMMGMAVVVDPEMQFPVVPGAALAFFDYDAFGKGIQYALLPMGLYNMGTLSVPNLPWGFDLGVHSSTRLLPSTNRPAVNGEISDKDGVSHQSGQLRVSIGRTLRYGFRMRIDGFTSYIRYTEAKEEKYRTPDYIIPPSGFTSSLSGEITWMYHGFMIRGNFGEGKRPDGFFGSPEDIKPIANGGQFKRWGGAIAFDYRLQHKAWIHTELGMERGTGSDRFLSVASIRAPGFRNNAVTSDQVQHASIGYVLPASQLFRLSWHIDHSRARSIDNQKTYGFTGMGVAADIPGFKWFTILRADIGIGIHSDISGLKGINGTIAALRIF
ncbi:MAG: hypothetical protein FWG02_07870 [Holophagaceae bacterium]|nr:hypothetical protein [Holophagaceae bacterium]